MTTPRERGHDAKPMFGWRASSAIVIGLVLVALGLVVLALWLTHGADVPLWYGDVPVP